MISIVMPTYNAEKYLKEAIDSILRQDYTDVEIVVVDGKSTDDTVEILKGYNSKIRWTSEKDRGEPDAINKGMAMARGDIITYLDGDDTYLPDALLAVSKHFESNPESIWAYGKCKIINGAGEETREVITKIKELFQKHYSFNSLLIGDFIAQPAAFWRKELVGEIGNFDIRETLAFEYDFWLRAGKAYTPSFIDKYLAAWRFHSGSLTVNDIYTDMKDAYRISKTHASSKPLINLAQLGVYLACISGYFAMNTVARMHNGHWKSTKLLE